MKKALVLTSGGIDSTTCLALAVQQYGPENVIALSMSYGQKHIKEVEAAKKVTDFYGVELITLDLSRIFEYSNCSLLAHSDKEIPKEDYATQIAHSDGDPVSTYVPFRNGLFLSCAASIAISKGCEVVFYGAHSDDAAGNAYPDCSDAFNNAMNAAIYEGSGGKLNIAAPFVSWTKADVVKKGLELHVPYELTWSCYEGKDKPCGVCGTCIDRARAFAANGVKDPALKDEPREEITYEEIDNNGEFNPAPDNYYANDSSTAGYYTSSEGSASYYSVPEGSNNYYTAPDSSANFYTAPDSSAGFYTSPDSSAGFYSDAGNSTEYFNNNAENPAGYYANAESSASYYTSAENTADNSGYQAVADNTANDVNYQTPADNAASTVNYQAPADNATSTVNYQTPADNAASTVNYQAPADNVANADSVADSVDGFNESDNAVNIDLDSNFGYVSFEEATQDEPEEESGYKLKQYHSYKHDIHKKGVRRRRAR